MTDGEWVAPGSGSTPPYGGAPDHPAPSGPPPAAVQTPPGPSGHWGPAPAIAFRPGIIPLRPLTLGDLYGAAVKAVRGNVGATVGLAVLTTLVFLVPATALGAWLGSQETATAGSDEPPVFGLVAASVP